MVPSYSFVKHIKENCEKAVQTQMPVQKQKLQAVFKLWDEQSGSKNLEYMPSQFINITVTTRQIFRYISYVL